MSREMEWKGVPLGSVLGIDEEVVAVDVEQEERGEPAQKNERPGKRKAARASGRGGEVASWPRTP